MARIRLAAAKKKQSGQDANGVDLSASPPPAWWSAIAPTGLAHEATLALTSPASGGVFALVKLVMALAAFTIAGILGEGRA